MRDIVSTNGGDGDNDPHDRFWYGRQITSTWQKRVENIVEVGRFLIEAKAEIPPGEYLKMLEHDVPFVPRTAQRLVKIAEHPVLSDATHGSHLPASWRTLSELALLSPRVLLARIADGSVHHKMQRSDVAKLLPGGTKPKKQSVTQLDRFKEKITEKDGVIADLQEELAAAEIRNADAPEMIADDASVEVIVNMMIDRFGEDKTKEIGAAIVARFKKPRGRKAKGAEE